jgi:hypothetical protein
MDFRHENGADATTSAPNSEDESEFQSNKFHAYSSPELPAPQPFPTARIPQPLVEACAILPPNWALVPVNHKKAPIGSGWQKTPVSAAEFIARHGADRRVRAFGVLAGPASGGLLLVDVDGASADRIIAELSGMPVGEALPPTVAWASGKIGRECRAYQVPVHCWGSIERVDRKTGVIGPDGKNEALDLRWGTDTTAFQSVVAGVHPETGAYQWLPGYAPNEIEVAEAPRWLIEAMVVDRPIETPKGEPLPIPLLPIAQPIAPAIGQQSPRSWREVQAWDVPVPISVPLENCLSQASRALLDGVSEGGRNNSMTSLARDLIGTETALTQMGQAFEGSAESLFAAACNRCSPPLPAAEQAAIWRSAQGDNPGPSLTEAAIENCCRSHWWRTELKPAVQPSKRAAKPKPGFSSNPATGLIYTRYDLVGGEVVPEIVQIGGHLAVEAHTNNCEGNEAGLYLKFRDQRGRPRSWTMARRLIGDLNAAVSELAARGYQFVFEQKKILFKFLAEAGGEVETDYTIAPRTGWVEVDGAQSFVLHSETIGSDSVRYLDVEPPSNPLLQRGGDLQSWQRTIGAMAIGNSRLIGAIGIALAPALLKPLEMEGGGIHIFGASSTGKTTALAVAISVTGEQRPATWNSTANGLEAGAEAHSDLLYPIDEIGQALPKAVDEASYNLANGAGRTRMARDLSARKIKRWVTLFLSTGEVAMLPFLKTAGITAKGGQEARMPSVPADAGRNLGLFDTIHSWASPQEFADELKTQGQINRGTALAAFLERLVPVADNPEWVDRQKSRHQAITNQLTGSTIDPDGTVGRVARRFALIQLALELAQSWQVTNFPAGQLEWAIERLFNDWIDARGGAGSIDIRQACDRIEALFVGQEFGDRIRHLIGERRDSVVRNLLAIKRGEEFLVPVSVFDSEIAQGVDRKLLIAELQKRKWIAPPGNDGRPAVQCKIENRNGRYFSFKRFWDSDDDLVSTPVTKTEKILVTSPVTAETVTGSGFDPVTNDIAGNQAPVTAETVAVTGIQPSGNQVTAISGYGGG